MAASVSVKPAYTTCRKRTGRLRNIDVTRRVSRSGGFSKGGRKQKLQIKTVPAASTQYTPVQLRTDGGCWFHSNLNTKGGFSEEL